jgi:hypothetical protein
MRGRLGHAVAGPGGMAVADDAAVIESSWREPERFAVLFDRHAPYIHRYLARRSPPTFLACRPAQRRCVLT